MTSINLTLEKEKKIRIGHTKTVRQERIFTLSVVILFIFAISKVNLDFSYFIKDKIR